MRGVFITGTGTDVGKTHFSLALVRALRARGLAVRALKPVETGCSPEPEDALALARAADRPELAMLPGLVRLEPPMAPAAIEGARLPSIDALARTLLDSAPSDAPLLVEGAGGLLVPYDARHDFSHLAAALGLPLVLVAPNRLGVLHDALATYEAAARRALDVRTLVLSAVSAPDPSATHNARLLSARLPVPVVEWPRTVHAAQALDYIERHQLLERLGLVS